MYGSSLPSGLSVTTSTVYTTTFCVFVMSCRVVITPRSMPIASWITLTIGARQLVVQDAAVSTSCRPGS